MNGVPIALGNEVKIALGHQSDPPYKKNHFMIHVRIYIIAFLASLTMTTFVVTPALAQNCCKCTSSSPPANNICITTTATDCAKMPAESKNANVKKLNCAKLNDAKCKKVAENGECIVGPTNELKYNITPKTSNDPQKYEPAQSPVLNIDIPDLSFSNAVVDGQIIKFPWFPQYVAAINKYLIGIVAVAAAIMIVYGGTLYIIGSAASKVTKGKTIIKDSIIGLIILVSAVTILWTVNPDTAQIKSIETINIKKIQLIPETTVREAQDLVKKTNFKPDTIVKKALEKNPSTAPPKTTGLPSIKYLSSAIVSPALAGTISPEPESSLDGRMKIDGIDLYKIVKDISLNNDNQFGVKIDPCILWGSIMHESGGGQLNSIGHDENTEYSDQRKIFLQYPNKTYLKKELRGSKTMNDDAEITITPPNAGLDMRFSHGVGPSQCTPVPPGKQFYCKGEDGFFGVQVDDRCFTIPLLLTWEGGLECLVKRMASKSKQGSPLSVCEAYCGFAGWVCGPTCMKHPLIKKKVALYELCNFKFQKQAR